MSRPDERDEEAVHRFIERFGADLVEGGLPPMPARIFAALLASDRGRLTSAELAEALHVSPAAISGGVRFLIQQRMASRERDRGTRRDLYVVRDDAWMEAILSRDQILAHWEASLRSGVQALGPDTPAGRRIGLSLAFSEFMHEELASMTARWQQRRAELTDGGRPA